MVVEEGWRKEDEGDLNLCACEVGKGDIMVVALSELALVIA